MRPVVIPGERRRVPTPTGAMLLDLSAHEVFVTLARLVARCVRGENVEGWSPGLAVSF